MPLALSGLAASGTSATRFSPAAVSWSTPTITGGFLSLPSLAFGSLRTASGGLREGGRISEPGPKATFCRRSGSQGGQQLRDSPSLRGPAFARLRLAARRLRRLAGGGLDERRGAPSGAGRGPRGGGVGAGGRGPAGAPALPGPARLGRHRRLHDLADLPLGPGPDPPAQAGGRGADRRGRLRSGRPGG